MRRGGHLRERLQAVGTLAALSYREPGTFSAPCALHVADGRGQSARKVAECHSPIGFVNMHQTTADVVDQLSEQRLVVGGQGHTWDVKQGG